MDRFDDFGRAYERPRGPYGRPSADFSGPEYGFTSYYGRERSGGWGYDWDYGDPDWDEYAFRFPLHPAAGPPHPWTRRGPPRRAAPLRGYDWTLGHGPLRSGRAVGVEPW